MPRAQSSEKESKLEVARIELMEEHAKWVKTHCNCKMEQVLNLSAEEIEGLKSLRLQASQRGATV